MITAYSLSRELARYGLALFEHNPLAREPFYSIKSASATDARPLAYAMFAFSGALICAADASDSLFCANIAEVVDFLHLGP